MPSIGTLTLNFRVDQKSLQSGLSKAQSSMDRVGRGMQKTGGNMSRYITAPILGIGAAAIGTAGSYEQSMNEVQAISGATGSTMDEMRAKARELGKGTRYSASEAGQGMKFLSMAGFEAEESIAAMPGTLDLAAAAGMDLGQAADISSNILTGFGLQAGEMGRAGDVMTKTFTSSNTTLGELGESMKMVGPVASGAGLSLEETSAAIGMMGNAGIKGTMAGTSLRRSLADLMNPSTKMSKKMDELGVNFYKADGSIRPLNEIVGELETTGASTADIMEIFGTRAGPAMASLVEEGSDSLVDLTEKLKNSEGASRDVAEAQEKGLFGAFRKLKSMASEVMLALTMDTGALDWMTGVVKGFTGILESLSTLNPTILKFAGIFAVVVAAVGPLLMILGTLSIMIGAISAPILIAVGVIAGLIAVGVLLYKNWDRITATAGILKNVLMAVWGAIAEFIRPVVQAITSFVSHQWNALLAWWKVNLPMFKQAAQNVFNAISAVIRAVMGVVSTIFNTILPVWKTVWGSGLKVIWAVVKAIFQTIGVFIDTTMKVIRGVITAVMAALTGDWGRAWEEIKGVATAIWNGIKAAFGVWLDALKAILTTVLSAVVSLWTMQWEVTSAIGERIWNAIKATLSTVLDAILAVWTTVWETVSSVASTIWEGIKSAITTTIEAVQSTIDTVLGAIESAWDASWSAIQTIADTIWSGIETVITTAINAVQTVIGTVLGSIESAWSTNWNAIKTAAATIWGAIESTVSTIMNTIKTVISTTTGVIKGTWSRVWGAIETLATNAINNVRGVVDTISGWVGIVSGALSGIKSAILGPFQSAYTAVSRKVSQIRGLMSKLNPLSRSSPAPITEVMRGMDRLRGDLNEQMAGITADVTGEVRMTRSATEGLSPARMRMMAQGGGGGRETMELALDLGEGIRERLRLERDEQSREFRVVSRSGG